MNNILKLIETDTVLSFSEVEPGEFYSCGDTVMFVSECASADVSLFDAYCVKTGEFFMGGAKRTIERANIEVKLLKQPEQLSFKQRIEIEIFELNEKLQKLEEFLNSDKSKSLPEKQMQLLTKQFSIMQEYQRLLQERINLLD